MSVWARDGEHSVRWGLVERCSLLGEVGEPYDTQQSTFSETHTSSSHSTTSPWSPIPPTAFKPLVYLDQVIFFFRTVD